MLLPEYSRALLGFFCDHAMSVRLKLQTQIPYGEDNKKTKAKARTTTNADPLRG